MMKIRNLQPVFLIYKYTTKQHSTMEVKWKNARGSEKFRVYTLRLRTPV